MKRMDKMKAKGILAMLNRINQQIDLVGKILVTNKVEPIPVRINRNQNDLFK